MLESDFSANSGGYAHQTNGILIDLIRKQDHFETPLSMGTSIILMQVQIPLAIRSAIVVTTPLKVAKREQ